MMTAVATAASQPGVSVVSMSWGFTEGRAVFQADEALYDQVLTTPAGHQGVTFVASTGDYGAANPEYPAFSPNVVAVGGTSLYLNGDNSYQSETGWGYYANSLGAFIGGGGGASQYEPEPSYQLAVQSTGNRTTPDVSFVADPATGVWVADTYNLSAGNPWEMTGGTSLSAPAWAGLVALANQGRATAGQPTLNSSSPTETQQALYSLPQTDFNAVSTGNNGYSAGQGYNVVTGLGTPVANLLIPDLVAYTGANVAPNGRTVTVTAATIANGSGTTNPFAIFDALIVGGRDWGQPGISAVSADPSISPTSPALPTFSTVRSSGTDVRLGASPALEPSTSTTAESRQAFLASDQTVTSTKSIDVSLFTTDRREMPSYWQAGDFGRTLARDGFFERGFLGTGVGAFVDEDALLGMPNYRTIEPDLIAPIFDTNDSDGQPATA